MNYVKNCKKLFDVKDYFLAKANSIAGIQISKRWLLKEGRTKSWHEKTSSDSHRERGIARTRTEEDSLKIASTVEKEEREHAPVGSYREPLSPPLLFPLYEHFIRYATKMRFARQREPNRQTKGNEFSFKDRATIKQLKGSGLDLLSPRIRLVL